MKNIIILKIGGSVITAKFSKKPKVDLRNLKRISKEIASAYEPKKMTLILIHGAGSFGHPIVKRTGIHKGVSKKKRRDLIALAETQRLQNKLNCIVTEELIKKGVPAFPYQASTQAVMKKGRLIKMDLETLKGLLDLNIIPVLYGVPAYDTKQGCSILSGDQIAPYLAKKLKAKKIIMASDVDGVFTADPKKDKDAKQVKEINRKNFNEIKKKLGESAFVDVTGGMLGKVLELFKMAKEGITSQIIDATKKDNIKKAFLGKKVGTIIQY